MQTFGIVGTEIVNQIAIGVDAESKSDEQEEADPNDDNSGGNKEQEEQREEERPSLTEHDQIDVVRNNFLLL